MIKKQRVLMIGWELPPFNSGGLGVACQGLTQALAADGVETTFLLPFAYAGNLDYMKVIDCFDDDWFAGNPQQHLPPFNAYDTETLPGVEKVEKLLQGKLPQAHSLMEKRATAYAELVLNFAKKHADEFDVVHAHDWMTMPAALRIKEELGKPFIAHIHSTEYDRSLSLDKQSFIVKSELEGTRLADRVIAVSYYTKRILVEKYNVNPYKIDVVHNGVLPVIEELEGIPKTLTHHRPVVAFMGRLTVQKGPDYFLDLAHKIISKKPETLFIVAGMGDMYEQLLFHNAGKSLSASVLFSGFVRGKAQGKILQRADVFVMPSLSEPFGLVAAEAASLGTPVLLSKNTGVAEVLTGSPQVDVWDIDAMVSETLRLLDDNDYRAEVIALQKQGLATNSWQKSAHQVKSIYHKIINKTKKVTTKTKSTKSP
jgi:glycosyltransferase involved in cell wall biosynthesis